jgi:hypothetical protein
LSAHLRRRLAELGLKSLPKILTLQDRNPHSPTYGCFDRNFWHLRVTDFPSGMAQEFVLPLALAYANPFEGNPFHRIATVREWIRAGIDYAALSAHSDGSTDDYYPFERAAGAAAFSLYAMVEALPLAKLDAEPFLPFLTRRANWLASHEESGRLSNHEALIANGLLRLARLSGDSSLATLAEKRVKRLLGWQSGEGWFYEYQGCDPGYLTLTLANMAEIDELRPDLGLREPIKRAVSFLHQLQPPDGWAGGEWTSRNTNNYFPHGLEMIGKWLPEATDINTRAVAALNPAPEYDDDHILGHHSWSYLRAALAWSDERRVPVAWQKDATWPEAGFAIRRSGRYMLLAALKKGGSYRLYDGATLIRSDTGISLRAKHGHKIRTYVCHLWNDLPELGDAEGVLSVSGPMGRAKASLMTPLKNVVLRLLMLSLGRMKPDLVRKILQRLLITGAPDSPFRFSRTLRLGEDGLEVTDQVHGNGNILDAGIGAAQTSIYTVMSRVYHPAQLQPWDDLTGEIRAGQPRLNVRRRYPEVSA